MNAADKSRGNQWYLNDALLVGFDYMDVDNLTCCVTVTPKEIFIQRDNSGFLKWCCVSQCITYSKWHLASPSLETQQEYECRKLSSLMN